MRRLSKILSRKALNYAEVLYSLDSSMDEILELLEPLKIVELKEALSSPAVSFNEKCAVIDRLFDKEFSNVLKVLCKNGDYSVLDSLRSAYKQVYNEHNGVVEGVLEYASLPPGKELERLKKTVAEKHNARTAELILVENKALIKGFRLTVNDRIYDNSALSALDRMYDMLTREVR